MTGTANTSRTSVRGRLTLRIGVLLVLAGLVVLGYVGWQLFVTNQISQREHRETVGALEREWREGRTSATVDAGTATAIVRIPALGEDYAVPLLEGTSDEALAGGIGHFTDSAAPGQRGNVALAAHRVTHGEPFRDLPDLEPGDEVTIETATRAYTYRLDTPGDALTVPFTQTWVVDPRPVNPDAGGVGPMPGQDRLLTLTTCSELFHTDGRLIAFGHLVRTAPRS